MKFEVGDKVKLKSDLVPDELYGELFFIDGMQFEGFRTVSSCENYGYLLSDDDNDYGFEYTDEMLEEYKEQNSEFIITNNTKTIRRLEVIGRLFSLNGYRARIDYGSSEIPELHVELANEQDEDICFTLYIPDVKDANIFIEHLLSEGYDISVDVKEELNDYTFIINGE